MNIISISIFLTFLLQCNGDVVGEGINRQLPLTAQTRIPIPSQSLLPPTFENPIKDYTVGLLPPPIDDTTSASKFQQQQPQQHHTHFSRRPLTSTRTHHTTSPTPTNNGFINSARPFRNSIQQRSGYSTVHQHTHHSSNVQQPQVYQPKTAIYQPLQQQQFTSYPHPHPHPHSHHYYQHQQYHAAPSPPPSTYSVNHHHHNHNHQYNGQVPVVSQGRVHHHHHHPHANAAYTQYASIPVQGYIQPSVQKSSFVSRPAVSSSGSSIIQTYPSVSYEVSSPAAATLPSHYQHRHGPTLNFGHAKLDPDLVHIVTEVVGQNHH